MLNFQIVSFKPGSFFAIRLFFCVLCLSEGNFGGVFGA